VIRQTSCAGTPTVLSGELSWFASSRSLKPMIDSDLGTAMPSRGASSRAPKASTSFNAQDRAATRATAPSREPVGLRHGDRIAAGRPLRSGDCLDCHCMNVMCWSSAVVQAARCRIALVPSVVQSTLRLTSVAASEAVADRRVSARVNKGRRFRHACPV
jgi:hypothetical protein